MNAEDILVGFFCAFVIAVAAGVGFFVGVASKLPARPAEIPSSIPALVAEADGVRVWRTYDRNRFVYFTSRGDVRY